MFEKYRYIWRASTSAAPPTPPCEFVAPMTISNNLSSQRRVIVTMTRVTGRSNGHVIFRKICHSDAPSTRAASKQSFGTVVRPAVNTIQLKPVHYHTDPKINPSRKLLRDVSQSTSSDTIHSPPNKA